MPRYQTINFLRERVRVQEAVLVADKRMALISSVSLGLFMTMFIGVVGYQFYLRGQLAVLDSSIAQAQSQLKVNASKIDALAQRESLLSTITTVVTKRGKSWDAIDYLYSVLPPETNIQSINLSANDGSLAFTVAAPDVFTYKKLSESLQSEQVKQSGFLSELGSLSRSATGAYDQQVLIFLTPPEATAAPDSSAESPTEEVAAP